MSKIGYLRLPRSFYDDPIWRSFSTEYRSIFMSILINCAWEETTQDDFGILVVVKPGQLLMTQRALTAEAFPPTDDKILLENYRSTTRRALDKFEKVGFSTQQTTHKKTLHTIIRKDLLDMFIPTNNPNSTQTRPLKTEVKKETSVCMSVNAGANVEENSKDDSRLIVAKSTNAKGVVTARIDTLTKELKEEGCNQEEINQAIGILTNSDPRLKGNIKNYLLGIITKQRKQQEQNEWKMKTTKKKKQPISTDKYEKDKGFYLMNDTSESPLAILARQNGLK